MIKKLVLAAISVLSLYFTYYVFMNGFNMWDVLSFTEDLKTLSFADIESQGEILEQKISEAISLNSTEIDNARDNVETEKINFNTKKEQYEMLEASASEEEIAEANKEQEYLLDYLWIVIGNYANDNNVKFKMETDDVNLRINFDITGSYVSIINFIYDLENDENLKFNLNGIQIASGQQADPTKASFSVDGVTVKTSNISVN